MKWTIGRGILKKENPNMTITEFTKQIVNEWSQLGQEEKQKYDEKANLDRERYNREFLVYKDFSAEHEAAKNANGDTMGDTVMRYIVNL